jgi:hypothetical protein
MAGTGAGSGSSGAGFGAWFSDARIANVIASLALLASLGSAWFARESALAARAATSATERANALGSVKEATQRFIDAPDTAPAFIATLRNAARLQEEGILTDQDIDSLKTTFPRSNRFLVDDRLCRAWLGASQDASRQLKALAEAAFDASKCR